MLASPSSASAISAALRMAWPAAPAFPLADRGRIRPTLTSAPLPAAVGPGGAAAVALAWDRSCELNIPVQAASPIAANSAAAIAIGCRQQSARAPWAFDRRRWKAMRQVSLAVSKYAGTLTDTR